MTKNKIKFGFKKLMWAPITRDEDGNPTYGTPVHEKGATEMSLEPNVETAQIPADDDPIYAEAVDDKGYTGDITLQIISDEYKKEILGWKEDSNGVLTEVAGIVPKEHAILCEFSGDAHATRHIFYRCMPTKPGISSKTKGDGLESQPDTISVTITPDPYSGNIHSAATPEQKTVYDSWFEKVYEPTYTTESEE